MMVFRILRRFLDEIFTYANCLIEIGAAHVPIHIAPGGFLTFVAGFERFGIYFQPVLHHDCGDDHYYQETAMKMKVHFMTLRCISNQALILRSSARIASLSFIGSPLFITTSA